MAYFLMIGIFTVVLLRHQSCATTLLLLRNWKIPILRPYQNVKGENNDE